MKVFEVLNEIQPLIESGFDFRFIQLEIRHLQIDVSQLVVKCLAILVFQLNGVYDFATFGFMLIIIKGKIQNPHAVNRL